MVEDVIETFESGNKKVYVRYHPDPNVLEKHFYNAAGEMIYLERDSLSFEYYFKKFIYLLCLNCTWPLMTMNPNRIMHASCEYEATTSRLYFFCCCSRQKFQNYSLISFFRSIWVAEHADDKNIWIIRIIYGKYSEYIRRI